MVGIAPMTAFAILLATAQAQGARELAENFPVDFVVSHVDSPAPVRLRRAADRPAPPDAPVRHRRVRTGGPRSRPTVAAPTSVRSTPGCSVRRWRWRFAPATWAASSPVPRRSPRRSRPPMPSGSATRSPSDRTASSGAARIVATYDNAPIPADLLVNRADFAAAKLGGTDYVLIRRADATPAATAAATLDRALADDPLAVRVQRGRPAGDPGRLAGPAPDPVQRAARAGHADRRARHRQRAVPVRVRTHPGDGHAARGRPGQAAAVRHAGHRGDPDRAGRGGARGRLRARAGLDRRPRTHLRLRPRRAPDPGHHHRRLRRPGRAGRRPSRRCCPAGSPPAPPSSPPSNPPDAPVAPPRLASTPLAPLRSPRSARPARPPPPRPLPALRSPRSARPTPVAPAPPTPLAPRRLAPPAARASPTAPNARILERNRAPATVSFQDLRRTAVGGWARAGRAGGWGGRTAGGLQVLCVGGHNRRREDSGPLDLDRARFGVPTVQSGPDGDGGPPHLGRLRHQDVPVPRLRPGDRAGHRPRRRLAGRPSRRPHRPPALAYRLLAARTRRRPTR